MIFITLSRQLTDKKKKLQGYQQIIHKNSNKLNKIKMPKVQGPETRHTPAQSSRQSIYEKLILENRTLACDILLVYMHEYN